MELIKHASQCDACGILVADLRSDQISNAVVPDSEERRHAMAVQLSKSLNPPEHRNRWWLSIAAGIFLALFAGGAWWIYRTHSQPRVYAVIAKTYSENRPFDFRFSGAPYGPVRVTRGGTGKIDSPELLEAEAEIARSLESKPADPSWLRAKGRVDLLEGRYSNAIDELRRARERDTNSSELSCDLAIAYMRRASIEQNPTDVLLAIDLLTSALKSDPGNAVYRFNRALAREQLPAPHEASDDWREFLRREPTGGWASEARQHLGRIEELLKKQRASSDGTGADLILDSVLRVLRQPKSEAAFRLAKTMLDGHADNWVFSLASDVRRYDLSRTLELDLRAEQSAAGGEPDESRELAQRAGREFQRVGSSAGSALAAYQEAYALQRSSHPECTQIARQALPTARRNRYTWLEAQLDLTLAACLSMEEEIVPAVSATQGAERAASRGQYPSTQMESTAMRAALLGYVGDYRSVLRLCHAALEEYWAGNYPLSRSYECYFQMASAARGLASTAATATLSREAVEIATLRSNRAIEGIIRSIHAADLARAGNSVEADHAFTLAEGALRSLKQSPSASIISHSFSRPRRNERSSGAS